MISPTIPDQLPPYPFHADPPWEPPRPLEGTPVPPFPADVSPAWPGAFVGAFPIASQTPPDLAGVLPLPVLSTAGARSIVVKPWGDWRESVNLFTIVVLPPGHRTSAVFADLVQPIGDYEYAVEHARVAVASAGDDPLADARYLVRAIWALSRPEVTHQRIWQATKARFRRGDALNAALALLVAHGYLRAYPGPECTHSDGTLIRGRPPAPCFELNPLVPSPSIAPRPSSPSPPSLQGAGLGG